MTDTKSAVEALIDKAAQAHDSGDAMRFSQAANNAANALACVANIPPRYTMTPSRGREAD